MTRKIDIFRSNFSQVYYYFWDIYYYYYIFGILFIIFGIFIIIIFGIFIIIIIIFLGYFLLFLGYFFLLFLGYLLLLLLLYFWIYNYYFWDIYYFWIIIIIFGIFFIIIFDLVSLPPKPPPILFTLQTTLCIGTPNALATNFLFKFKKKISNDLRNSHIAKNSFPVLFRSFRILIRISHLSFICILSWGVNNKISIRRLNQRRMRFEVEMFLTSHINFSFNYSFTFIDFFDISWISSRKNKYFLNVVRFFST